MANTKDLQTMILQRVATVSQVEVARLSGIDNTHISKFVGGDPIHGRGLRIDQLGPFLDALGLTVIEACHDEVITIARERYEALRRLARDGI